MLLVCPPKVRPVLIPSFKKMPLTAIRWIRPGSSYHGVVHYVGSDLVHDVEGKPGRVVVHWPNGSKVVLWKGERVKSGKAKRHLAVRLPPSKGML